MNLNIKELNFIIKSLSKSSKFGDIENWNIQDKLIAEILILSTPKRELSGFNAIDNPEMP